jgi:DNA-binding transcriptional MerR regulator
MTNSNLDDEWILLIQEALQQGLSIEEIKSFLKEYTKTTQK